MPFLTNCWQVAAFSSELEPGQLLRRLLCDEWIVLYRIGSGQAVALEDRCPHRSLPLSRGVLAGDVIRCGYHGMEFGADGACVKIPGQEQVPAKARARAFPVSERYRLVWIWLGAPEKANTDLIPDVHWLDDAAWDSVEGHYEFAANYRLLTDNLLDLTHETYVHQRTIGNEAVAETELSARNSDGAVLVEREMDRCFPPPFFQYLAQIPASQEVRRWQRTTYRPPGYCVIDVGVETLEKATELKRVEGRVINLITPASSATSHYFWAFSRDCRRNDPSASSFLRDKIVRTFDEDKEILELQQANLGPGERDPLYKIAVKADAGVMLARRALDKALAEAAGQSSAAIATRAAESLV